MMLTGLLAASFGVAMPAWAGPECAEPVSSQVFFQKISEAETAYGDLDLPAFRSSRMQARQMVGCLQEPLTPAQAAGFHRLEALAAFIDRDHARAVLSLRALVAAAPGYQLPADLAPEGHPLGLYFTIAEQSPTVPGAPLPAMVDGWAQIDGASSTEWPIDRPYLYQELSPSGQVRISAIQNSGASPPGFEKGASVADRGRDAEARTARTLGVVSVGSAVLAGGMYLGARASSRTFWDPATASSELEALRRRTNTLGAVAAGFGVVSVGTGGAAMIVGVW